ncbi:MAG TPA: response regulator, partial [Coleofasciculaceae cyanobacterium]
MRILIVDDDELLTQTLITNLTAQRYVVDVAADGEAGWNYAQAAAYDLIVLDINLPKLNGIRLCQQLRQNNCTSPILLLTAKGESSDKVVGLDAGADDYVVKPCSIEELCARIRALLRRQTTFGTLVLQWGNLRLDPNTCSVTYQEQPLALSPKEYRLLELFLRSPQRIFNSSSILEHLWGFKDSPSEETVRTHIKRLRHKLKSVGAEDLIETIYGMGYRLKSPVNPQPSLADQARAAAAAAWEHLKKPTLERITVLDQAVAALQMGNLPEHLRWEAEQIAHKLAGSLGMFGFPVGSQLGRDIEQELQQPNGTELSIRLQTMVDRLRQELQQSPTPIGDGLFSTPDPEGLFFPQGLSPLLLIVDSDTRLIQQFQQAAAQAQIQIEAVSTIAEAKDKLAEHKPDAVLLDLASVDTFDQGLIFLEELGECFPNLPVWILTADGRLEERLAAARCSKHQFISKSTAPVQVLEGVQNTLRRYHPSTITVLAVDDDPAMLDHLKQVLPQWGIWLIPLQDPLQFWETLEEMTPDLLLLGTLMTTVSGMELCQVVRNDSNWSELPILVLSTSQDTEAVDQIYSAGADDYILKPFTESDLVARIFNRLERNQVLRNLPETDPLTGLTNQQQATKQINRCLNLARCYHQPFYLAILELDNFHFITEQYSHDTKNQVIRRIAQILWQMFPRGTIIARWSDEKFCIGMQGVEERQAMQQVHQILQAVHQEKFCSLQKNRSFQITLSAGLAKLPEASIDLRNLCQMAETALYQAKT